MIPESWVDVYIPFSPTGIWLYLLFYLYIPYCFLTVNESKVKPISLAFVLTSFISGIIFILVPSSLHFPVIKVDGISAALLNFVSVNDTDYNCFPSMHASLITISTLALLDKTQQWRSLGAILLTVLMYGAIIQVRRHVFIDLAGGIAIAIITWGFSVQLLKKRK